ncbi:MAG TPA: GNAT family N-acetyltransferase, partial [Nannocystaceae bacterium]|nr:GNAT family N-acetyltransferase [Nannocystaceae bacterium]
PYPARPTWYGTLEWHTDPTYVVELESSAEHHLAHVCSQRHLRDLKTTRKRGLVVVTTPTPAQRAAYVELYRKEHAARGWSGEIFDASLFEIVAERMGRGGELVVLVHDDRVVGGGVLLYDRHAVHYFQGTVDRDVKGVYPHVSLLAHALEQAELRGVRRLNMGGVNEGNESLIRFKESWGAKPLFVPRLAWSTALRGALRQLGPLAASLASRRR